MTIQRKFIANGNLKIVLMAIPVAMLFLGLIWNSSRMSVQAEQAYQYACENKDLPGRVKEAEHKLEKLENVPVVLERLETNQKMILKILEKR